MPGASDVAGIQIGFGTACRQSSELTLRLMRRTMAQLAQVGPSLALAGDAGDGQSRDAQW